MGRVVGLTLVALGAWVLVGLARQGRDFRLRSRYLDEQAKDLDDALARIGSYTTEGKAVSIGLLGNAAQL